MLRGVDVRLNTNFLADRRRWSGAAAKIIYTGTIDAYYDFCFGALEYCTVRFEAQTPWTRIIEHKCFTDGGQQKTVVTKEYSEEWRPGAEPYYPVHDKRNSSLCARYQELAAKEKNVILGGRLGEYAYNDMDRTIRAALDCWETERSALENVR